jgi:hypothetical protein
LVLEILERRKKEIGHESAARASICEFHVVERALRNILFEQQSINSTQT